MRACEAATVARIRQLVQRHQDAHGSERGAEARRVNGHLRALIADEQRYRCALCGSLFSGGYHIDHKRPQCQRGTSDRSNLWALCLICHARKTALEQSMRVEAARQAAREARAGTDVDWRAGTSVDWRAGTSVDWRAGADVDWRAGAGVGLPGGEAYESLVRSRAVRQAHGSGDGGTRADACREVRLLADWDAPFLFDP